MKKFEVAIIYDEQGNELGCLKCKLVDEKDYDKLKIKTSETLAKQQLTIRQIHGALDDLEKKIADLEHEIKVLKGEE